MFLFLEDHQKYPNAIIDTATTNTSWLHMASVLKSMGVKNYYFHLILNQPILQGVDPHDPNLSIELKTAIALECEHNIWYYFREVARVDNGNTPLKFALNRGTLSVLWAFCCGIDYALIMPRQIGKSVVCEILDGWLMYFYYRNTKLFLFTKDDGLRKVSLDRTKAALKLLPSYLNRVTKNDADNSEVLTCVLRGNKMMTGVGQAVHFNALNMGRGHTYPYVRMDEGPFIHNVHVSLPVLSGATATARENYEQTNTLYGSIYTTTAGKLDSKEGAYMHSFIYSGMFWNESLYDCKDKFEAREMVKMNSPEGRCLIHGTFSHRQCGKTDDWLRRVIALAKRTVDEISRDYLNKWTSGTEYSALSTQLLEIISASERDPLYMDISTDKYMMRWYVEKNEIDERMANSHFILSLDSSNAVGRDANGLSLSDVKDMSIVATSNVSEANLYKYAVWIANFLIKYPNVTFIIEHKSSATSIIDTISVILVANKIDPFKRIYNSVVDNYKTKEEAYKEICQPLSYRPEKVYLQYKSSFGFLTTGNSRQFLYDIVLQDAAKSTGHKVFDSVLASELKGLIVKNGRVDHLPGGHDDIVISWLLAHWFVKHSKNLTHYGINPTMCLSLTSADGAMLSTEELEQRKQLGKVTQLIDELKAKMLTNYSIIDNLRSERLLAHYIREANTLGDSTLSMDAILREVNEKRSTNKATRNTLQGVNAQRLGLSNFKQHF